jgi:hypothetical protein
MTDHIRNEKDFVHIASDLTDIEAQNAFKTIVQITNRYSKRANTVENLEMLRDEVLTRLAEQNILASLDPSPCLYGDPPLVTIEGKIASDYTHKYGMDHEKKQFEVRKAHKRGEDYLGERENVNSSGAKKRSKNSKKR